MKRQWRGTAALVACLGLLCLQSASAERQREYQMASDAAEQVTASLASYNSFESGGCESCDSYGCDSCNSGCDVGGPCHRSGSSGGIGLLGFLQRPSQFYVAAEYMQVRASFSEATAFVTQSQNATVAPPTITSVFTPIEYDHDPSYRIFGGYRLCDCAGEIQFGYTSYDSDGSAQGIPSAGDIIVAIPEEVFTNTIGQNIDVNSNVSAESVDLAFSKTIPLGGCCPGDCGDACCGDSACDCGGACGTTCCPAWDITWTAGVRYSQVDWDRTSTVVNPGTNIVGNSGITVMDFEGAGPRWGLEGRRYLGSKYRFSLFLKGDISLLLGDVEITNTRIARVAGAPTLANITRFNTTQIIPVLDIVAGGNVNITDRFTLSGGYLFSAWHDLGMRDTFDILDDPGFANPTDLTFDDANILGFDGWFARAEYAF